MNKLVVFILLSVFVNGLFIVAFNPVSASELVENSWSAKTSMQYSRSNFGVVTVDGKIYAIGGNTNMGYVATNECYDPATDMWVTLEPMPTPRMKLAVAEYQGKIYCMGGVTGGSGHILFESLDVVEVYDISTNSWSTKSSMPIKTGYQAHVVDDKFFVVTQNALYVYDPVTDMWTNRTNIPTEGVAFSVMVDDKIIFGSPLFIQYQEPMPMRIVIYDTKTDKWSEGQTGPDVVYRYPIAAGATTGQYAPKKVYISACVEIYADDGSFVKLDMVNQVYDPIQDTWSSANAMSLRRKTLSITVVDDILYAIDGGDPLSDDVAYSAVNEQYVPIGYRSTGYTTPTPSNMVVTSKPTSTSTSESSKLTTTQLIIVVLTLTVGATTILVFYFRKRTKY